MQSRSRWDFFDMQIESANKGGGDKGFFFFSPQNNNKKKFLKDGIVMKFCWGRKM